MSRNEIIGENLLKNSDEERDSIENDLNDDSVFLFFFLLTLLRSFSLALTTSQKRSNLLICINQIRVDNGGDKSKECSLSESRDEKSITFIVFVCVHLSLMKNQERKVKYNNRVK